MTMTINTTGQVTTIKPQGNGTQQPARIVGMNEQSDIQKDMFLKLMLAQLKNQDPMKPTDPSEFLGQLAQFSQVSGIQSMQESMQTLSDSLRSSQVLDGTTLVGHEILAAADEATLGAAGSIAGAVDVPDNATAAQIVVTDTAGQVIRRVPVSAQAGTGDAKVSLRMKEEPM
jgi:flagellar basal-body rod modification protein FlgD